MEVVHHHQAHGHHPLHIQKVEVVVTVEVVLTVAHLTAAHPPPLVRF